MRKAIVLLAVAGLAPAPPLAAQLGPGFPVERLQASDRAAGDLFACALDLDRSTLLVGSLLDDDLGPDSGSAYVFELVGEPEGVGWRETAKLLAPDGAAGDQFGFAVALDGDRALVGAPLAGAGGAVYQFHRAAGAWRLVATEAPAEPGGAAGSALALTATHGLAGAPAADVGGRIDAGAVIAFPLAGLDGERPAAPAERLTAVEPQAGAGFGWSLAAGGGLVAVGAPWADAPFTGGGAVHLFAEAGGAFQQVARIAPADAAPFAAFGYSVALAGDLLAVGAPRAAAGAGAVYVLRRTGGPGGAFALEARLAGTVPGAQLGTAVALEGELLAAGARLEGGPAGAAVGAVRLFRREGGAWPEVERFQPAAARPGDEVGIAVALSDLGLAAGAYRDDGGGIDAGAAYVRVPAADLALTKRVETPAEGAAAPPGSEVVFVVEVENRGPGDAAGARVRDELPAGLEGATWTCEARDGAACTPAGRGAIDERVDLPAGSGVTFRIAGSVAPGAAGELVNRASVAAPPGVLDPEPGNDAGEARVPVGPVTADLCFEIRSLALAEHGGPGFAVPGEPIVHEVEICNLGPSDAPPLAFAGGGLGPAFVGPTWTCAAEDRASCVPGTGAGPIAGTITLPAGSRVIYTLEATVSPAAVGTLVLAGGLGPLAGLDPNPANNADRAETPLVVQSDLAVTLSPPLPPGSGPLFVTSRRLESAAVQAPGDGVTLRPEETVIYEVRYANEGPSDAVGAPVAVTLAPGLAPVGWTCQAFGGGASCSASDPDLLAGEVTLPVGATALFTATVAAVPGFLGPQPVSAEVRTREPHGDPDLSNNRATDPGPVLLPEAGVAATLEVLGSFLEGSTVTYVLVVANGAAVPLLDLPGDEVTDVLPPELELVGVSASSGTVRIDPPSTVAWNGEIPPGGFVVIKIEAKIRPGTLGEVVANQATVLDQEGAEVLSAPPGAEEPAPTVFTVASLLEIPAASVWGLAALALLLAALALGFLGRTA